MKQIKTKDYGVDSRHKICRYGCTITLKHDATNHFEALQIDVAKADKS